MEEIKRCYGCTEKFCSDSKECLECQFPPVQVHQDLPGKMDPVKKFTTVDKPVTSDGGSTPEMYRFKLKNKSLIDPIDVETGDVIRDMLGNDFDFGNVLKALRRLYMTKLGKGKMGNTASYEIKKIRYFLDQIEREM